MDSSLLAIGLAVGLVIAAVTDVKLGRIPNWLTFSLAGFGMTVHTILEGWAGFFFSVEGLGFGIGCLLLFYIMGGMGAGDVKFLGSIGAVVGSPAVLHVFLITALLGGLYALAMMIHLGGGRYAWNRVAGFFTTMVLTKSVPKADRSGGGEPKLRYALVIGLGTIFAQSWEWYGRW